MNDKLLIRADAYPAIGTGHVMRCIALAQEWKSEGGIVLFHTYCESKALLERLKVEGFEVLSLPSPEQFEETLNIINSWNPDWVVLDGYHFEPAIHDKVKDKGQDLLIIDDYMHLDRYNADLILNQNFGADSIDYSSRSSARVLAGTDYVLLRKEFFNASGGRKSIPDKGKRLLVTLGGSDPDNITLKALEAIEAISDSIEVKTVLGANNPSIDSIAEFAEKSRHSYEILIGVENMLPHMAWADVAFTAGGSTLWELSLLGVPSIACIIAENQRPAVESLSSEGIVISVGDMNEALTSSIANQVSGLLEDRSLREKLSARCSKIVDGTGAKKVIDAMLKHKG